MRKYLAELPHKPDHHKKRFALLASGVFTLTVFIVWALVRFGTSTGAKVAESQNDYINNMAAVKTSITPLQAIGESFRNAFDSINSEFSSVNKSVQSGINTNGR